MTDEELQEAFAQARREAEAKRLYAVAFPTRVPDPPQAQRPGLSPSWSDLGRKASQWLSAGLFSLLVVGLALVALWAIGSVVWRLVGAWLFGGI
jgi:hypothetical protein